MSGHRIPFDLFSHQNSRIKDPGSSGTIEVQRNLGHVALVSAGVEARTLAAPTHANLRLCLFGKTVSGTITLTVTGGYNEDGTTIGRFTAAGQYVEFISVEDGSNYRWRVVGYEGFTGPSSSRVVNCTAATLTVTEALHDSRLIVLDRAAGIAVTLPAAAVGLWFRFYVKTTFTSAATIKSVSGADVMIGGALMGNNTDNTVVEWPAVAANTFDTIDLLGTSNSTGGMAGQEIEIIGLAANLWYVRIRGDAAGTEATPFADTVA